MPPVFLLATKFYIPPARTEAVVRPRLTEKLLAGIERPGSCLLVSGPAGFGKTTLLSEFAAQLGRSGPPPAWVSLDEGDNDPIRFWTCLIAACQSRQASLGAEALALFQSPQPLPDEAVPTLLLNDLAALDQELVLILDDYHAIHNPALHTACAFLVDHLPPRVHLALATRHDPPWPLARWRARDRLVEIRAQDLRFTPGEAAQFLRQTTGLDLPQAEVAALETRTEGWIAGLQLASISLKGHPDPAGFIQEFSGSQVYVAEYLLEEVFQRQPAEIQSFLLQTSILDRLHPELCAAVIGGRAADGRAADGRAADGRAADGRAADGRVVDNRAADGRAMLAALQRANLFVLPLDEQGEWFRYHHLFADLLQARLRQALPPAERAALHRRAAAWFEQAGMLPQAIEHALAAGDPAQAGRLIAPLALPVILQGFVRTVEGWLQAIPPAVLAESLPLNLAGAWLNVLRGTFDQAPPYLERLTGLFAAQAPGSQDPGLQAEWLAIQAEVLNREERPAESRERANQALKILPEGAAHVRSMLYVNLADACQQTLAYEQAAGAYQQIIREGWAAGNLTLEILGLSGWGQMALQLGELQLAFKLATQGIERLEASGQKIPFGATLYGELGQVYYHRHQLELAKHYFQRSARASGQSGYSDPELYQLVMQARLAQMEADWETAAQAMQQAAALMLSKPPAMIREEVISQQVRVFLACGQAAQAQALLEAEGFCFEPVPQLPPRPPEVGIARPAGLLYNSVLRLLLHQAGEDPAVAFVNQAVALAGQVLDGELRCRSIPAAVETLLLRAQLRAALPDPLGRLEDVAQALQRAEPEGFISIFVEEGPAVAEALRALRTHPTRGRVRPAYIQSILEAFPGAVPAPAPAPAPEPDLALLEPLTRRELEVLDRIAAGDSNQAIAGKLFITLSAVKKHTGHIYAKLNVSSRTQAVAIARQLQILPPER